MEIGVISDTHAGSLQDIPEFILKALAEVDLIIHAGDFTSMAVLEGLRTLGEVKAVHGNMDSPALKQTLPLKEEFEISGKRFGLTHGFGGPQGIAGKIRQLFAEVDVIIYGHSHEPHNKIIEGSLLFNPGSARESFGLLTIDESVKAEIIKL